MREGSNYASRLVASAEELARKHHTAYDPSHDFQHVHRVRSLALLIARSLAAPYSPSSSQIDASMLSSPSLQSPNLLVVHLAALFHDLLDSKYLPAEQKGTTARTRLAAFWEQVEERDENGCAHAGDAMDQEERRLVERIVENVSFSKEMKRRAVPGAETEWHRTCLELHCVQDADKLDAIGAFGILRCAAYSGASNIALYSDPSLTSTLTPSDPSQSVASLVLPCKSTAIDHFDEKLFKLESMMKTEKGREMARSRTLFMRSFIDQIQSEVQDVHDGI